MRQLVHHSPLGQGCAPTPAVGLRPNPLRMAQILGFEDKTKKEADAMSHRINLRLPEDLFSKVENAARENGLAINQYITSILTTSLNSCSTLDSFVEEISESIDSDKTASSTYRFSPGDVSILRRKARSLGLSDTAYLRKVIRTKDFKYIDCSLDDLREYMTQSQKLIDSVTQFVHLIETNGKGIVFEQDVRRILSLLLEIKDLHKEQLQTIYENRRSAYKMMLKKMESE